jgi:hypothetical protein
MPDAHRAGGQSDSPGGGYERRDLSLRAIVVFGIFVAASVLLSILVAYWLFWYSADEAARTGPRLSPLAQQEAPQGPRLQVNAPGDLRKFRAQEDALLDSYGWINREAGSVHIPIDRAMRLLVERGLPVTPEAAAGPPGQGS